MKNEIRKEIAMSILSAQNINFAVDEKQILTNISLDVAAGECISLMGPSGSGKSTFLKMCSYLISPTEGKMYYKDEKFSKYDPMKLRQSISYCTQIPYLFGTTVKENLEFPYIVKNQNFDSEWIASMLVEFGLDESFVDKDVATLSGGEKQRIALIRNLVHKPEILLLDEVTSALDEMSASLIEQHVKKLVAEGMTVLWVTHNEEQSTKIFNKRVRFVAGEIVDVEVL